MLCSWLPQQMTPDYARWYSNKTNSTLRLVKWESPCLTIDCNSAGPACGAMPGAEPIVVTTLTNEPKTTSWNFTWNLQWHFDAASGALVEARGKCLHASVDAVTAMKCDRSENQPWALQTSGQVVHGGTGGCQSVL